MHSWASVCLDKKNLCGITAQVEIVVTQGRVLFEFCLLGR